MTERQTKEHLREALVTLTAGSILHLLSEVFHEEAEEARHAGDVRAYKQCRNVEATLFVVGLGIDSARPR
jgi:hypothetical protein